MHVLILKYIEDATIQACRLGQILEHLFILLNRIFLFLLTILVSRSADAVSLIIFLICTMINFFLKFEILRSWMTNLSLSNQN